MTVKKCVIPCYGLNLITEEELVKSYLWQISIFCNTIRGVLVGTVNIIDNIIRLGIYFHYGAKT